MEIQSESLLGADHKLDSVRRRDCERMRLILPNAGDGNESVRARHTADRLVEGDLGCQARKRNDSCVVIVAVVEKAGGTNKPLKDINATDNGRRVRKFVWFVESNEHHRN